MTSGRIVRLLDGTILHVKPGGQAVELRPRELSEVTQVVDRLPVGWTLRLDFDLMTWSAHAVDESHPGDYAAWLHGYGDSMEEALRELLGALTAR